MKKGNLEFKTSADDFIRRPSWNLQTYRENGVGSRSKRKRTCYAWKLWAMKTAKEHINGPSKLSILPGRKLSDEKSGE
jgi:hypothetical protein